MCDHLFSPSTITYRHVSLDQNKWNDHFLVSESIMQRGLMSDHKVIEDGGNVSDHLPISMSLSVNKQCDE